MKIERFFLLILNNNNNVPNNLCFLEQVTEGSLPNDTQVQLGVLLDEQ